MAVKDYWERMLVYFGIAEEDYDGEHAERQAKDQWDEPREAQRKSHPRRASGSSSTPASTPSPRARRPRSGGPTQHVAGVGVVPPRTFNDAQVIADQFRVGSPVIINLQQTPVDLSKRIIDFASGLTYGLDGHMQRIADKVFLLTPADVSVSSEERAAMAESGFFNQS